MCDTVFSDRFKDLRDATGRPSLAYQTQSLVQGVDTPEEQKTQEEKWEAEGGHPQKRMMLTIDDLEDRAVLCFDCGEDMQPAHFGEMSCPLALCTWLPKHTLGRQLPRYPDVLEMPDFPMLSVAGSSLM